MLIHTTDGILNTDAIARAEHVSTGAAGRSKITYRDGTTGILNVDISTLEEACGTIVPAQPGFAVVFAFLPDVRAGERDVTYAEEPVIAFRIGSHGNCEPFPITLTGEPQTRQDVRWTLVQPNGRCINFDATHDNIDAFKAECERAALARLAA